MPSLAAPRDRAKREHVARVERVVFSDPTDPFCVIALADGLTACGPADADRFDRGTTYRFLGRWEDDARRGWRFRFGTYVVHGQHGRAGVLRYLTDTCDGLGIRTAEKLWAAFGADAVQVLRADPERAARDAGLNPEDCRYFADQLRHASATEHTRIELFELFDRRGFRGELIDAAISAWGAKAPVVVRRNPFALLGKPSAGFKRCDRLWTDLALPPAALKRQAVVASQLAKDDPHAHTWLAAHDLAARLKGLIPQADPVRAFKFALRARLLTKHRDREGKLWLAVSERGTAEERLAREVARLMAAPVQWPTDAVPTSQRDGDRLPSAHQVERLLAATAEPIGILRGGPGTGKSHLTGYLCRTIVARYGVDSLAVCAPTGKAAKRASESLQLAGVNLPPRTIHRLLGVGRNGHDGEGWGFEHDADNPLPVKFLFVDESSMIDTSLLASLLAACSTGTHVLLVGDPDQLPPVGHGAPLRDLIACGVVPVGELTEVRRNAGQIVHACVRIRNNESFDTADRVDLEADPPRNLKHVHAADDAAIATAVEQILRAMRKFDPVWQTQVLVARNKGSAVGRRELNDRLQPLLNPSGRSVNGNPFRCGDKIICLKNSRMHVVEAQTDDAEENAVLYATVTETDEYTGRPVAKEQFVANGEIGRVVAVATGLTVARFSESDDLVKIPMGKNRDPDAPEADAEATGGRGCDFDLGYAITVHKAQGSEAPCVIVVADPAGGRVTDRSWLYTAVSRASKLCLLVGPMAAIDGMRARVSIVRRQTFLSERLSAETTP